MPVYEYHCDGCGEDFEELVLNRAAERDIACPACASDNVVKLLSGSTVRSNAGSVSAPASKPRGGGCHGGGCGCH
jgi:putative FmdB family regulatory protein